VIEIIGIKMMCFQKPQQCPNGSTVAQILGLIEVIIMRDFVDAA
jgi:hypothetical protein